MKGYRFLCAILAVMLMLWGCKAAAQPQQTLQTPDLPVLGLPDPSVVTEQNTSAPAEATAAVGEETVPQTTAPRQTEPRATEPKATEPKATEPKPTESKPTAPKATEPPAQPKETQPSAAATQAPTEPKPSQPTAEFKRQIEYYAALYLNEYRSQAGAQACQVLPGMSNVARMRAGQLTYNFSHSTSDKRAALAYYQYGRWIDASLFGGTPEESYYEADSAEAICAGFRGVEAEAMGKRIADMIRGSASHWSYVGSSEYSYIAVGVEYRAGTAYGWYGCVMVGKVNYG